MCSMIFQSYQFNVVNVYTLFRCDSDCRFPTHFWARAVNVQLLRNGTAGLSLLLVIMKYIRSAHSNR